jgi:O-antigen ligase
VRDYLFPLLQLQRVFIPVLLAALCWAIWRTVVKKDLAVGLALYLSLVVIVDGFYNTGIYLPGLSKGSIRYSELCAAFLFFNRPSTAPRRAPYATVCLLLGIYFFLMVVSVLRSEPLLPAIFEFRQVIIPQVVAFLVAVRLLERPEEYRRFFLCLTGLVLLVGVFVFWDFFFDRWILHSDVLDNAIYWANRKQGRYGSVFLNPNYLGAFVVLVFPALFAYFLDKQGAKTRLYCGTGLLALAFCLIETKSRGPLLAFAVVLILLVIGPIRGMSRMRRFGILAFLGGVLFLFMPGFFETSVERFDVWHKETSMEGQTRQTMWDYAWRFIIENPIGGIGFGEGQFRNAMAATDFLDRFGLEALHNPHNSYLQAAVYAGIPALAAFIVANLTLLAHGLRASRGSAEGAAAPAAFALTVGIFGFLLSIYPDMHLFTWTVAPVYWVFAGLLVSLVSNVAPGRAAQKAAGPPDVWPTQQRTRAH